MDNYEKGEELGKGQFGIVFKAKDKRNGDIVAIKKIRLGLAKEGVNMTALREVKLLKELDSPHIVKLLDVFVHKNNLALVFEYMESDLEMVIKNRATILSPADVKAYMQMLLQALQECHSQWIVHRDIKPNNFLVSTTGELKVTDFGLARTFGSPGRGYTNQVFARWYRAPELLFGSNLYGPCVDMWAAGCCFAELLLRKPWMPGMTDIEQLSLIFQNLGTPTDAVWPGARGLPNYVEFQATIPPPLKSIFPKAGEDALSLLSQLMAFDPRQRPTASQALAHKYFRNGPRPSEPGHLPKPPIRAHNPLKLQPQGGSALQAAPGMPDDAEPGTGDGKGIKRKLDLDDC